MASGQAAHGKRLLRPSFLNICFTIARRTEIRCGVGCKSARVELICPQRKTEEAT